LAASGEKVGRAAAKKAFPKARETASLEEIMAGLQRYQDDQKAKATPMQFWLHPSTFLNQERWTDEPEPIMEKTHGTNNANTRHNRARQTFTEALLEVDERLEAAKSGQATNGGFSHDLQGGLRFDERREKPADDDDKFYAMLPFIASNTRADYPDAHQAF